jgi:hypothetical protein
MTWHLSVTEPIAPSARRGLPQCRLAPLTTILTGYDCGLILVQIVMCLLILRYSLLIRSPGILP